MEGIHEVFLEMASFGIIYIPSFMTIGRGVQAILRFYLKNMRHRSVGIIDGRYL
jgi:hypothetical protein